MSVFLNNLDDFIAPGQACVNPLVSAKLAPTSSSRGHIILQADVSTTELGDTYVASKPDLIKSRPSSGTEVKVAHVSLNDCLACSGCVTSAEAMLIQLQSNARLIEKLEEAKKRSDLLVVMAISPQSRASLASKLGIPSEDIFLRLATFLKTLGVSYVLDSSSAGDVSLLEAREEFLYRYRQGRSAAWTAPACTTALSSSRIHMHEKDAPGSQSPVLGHEIEIGAPNLTEALHLPMLISACPGWICYAEKTQPQTLPFTSSAKSAQQVLGAVFKRYFARGQPANVFMVSVQPCYDKKLEASRLDFVQDAQGGVTDVDLVLSTGELWQMLSEHAQSLAFQTNASADEEVQRVRELLHALPADPVDGKDEVEKLFRSFSDDGKQLVVAADSEAGSGGYLDYILRSAAEVLLGKNLWGPAAMHPEKSTVASEMQRPALPLEIGRNVDIAEVVVHAEAVQTDGMDMDVEDNGTTNAAVAARTPSLRFAKIYGFRNIQSLMLKMKRGKCDYDLVEVMACPSGCVNGGGQLRSASNETAAAGRERVAAVNAEFHRAAVRRPEDSPLVQFLYGPDRLERPLSAAAMELLHTRYHAVPKLEEVAPLAAKW